ncbi:hypothetical protein GCM10009720_12610 [Yaniella flava]|uniref:Uncharacterized protein n=1 Tax=Yaniella flava TaxID=287930 RepID=A0ABP5FWE4_9MICC
MSEELNSAWQTVRLARESERSNPRMLHSQNRRNYDEVSYEEILHRVDEGISHLRNLTRTLREASYASGDWDERFREGWVEIARDVGVAIADPEGSVAEELERLTKLSTEMSDAESLPNIEWPVYGSLIHSLRHIVIIVDDVASAQEARDTSKQG